ncbi:FadR family transcriptional regulator [Paenibacillus sp. WQ 127069]|uniref:FadR family transcriptional regulator n=1 Tax=Paenibacillus baimaensis TaxID=2982185 RepID=A0ABT2UIZ4_9BACL|nr:FadR/GntR family transcriptional regulator [Paenibacillus sp. WQ 127069]MCU6793842.1 FadR family transcriptional regulator [Paenibacillus sp. WQ 127069]
MEISEKMNLSHIVSERIKNHIIENELKEGERLPSEKQLIDMLGVSRTVVRESLKSLEMIGILKIKTGDGIYVNALSLKPVMDQVSFRWHQNERKMKELLATRRILELGAVEMAIEKYDLSFINQMDVWNEAMAAKLDSGQMPLEEDLQFHQTLFRATGNETYFELSELITDFFLNIRQLHFGNLEDTKKSIIEHQRLVEYIRAKDVSKAKKEMELHLRPLKKYTD